MSETTLDFEGALGIARSHEFAKALLDALESEDSVKVDLSGVESCDVTALQVLVSAEKTAHSQGKTFGINDPQGLVKELAAGCGLDCKDVEFLGEKSQTEGTDHG